MDNEAEINQEHREGEDDVTEMEKSSYESDACRRHKKKKRCCSSYKFREGKKTRNPFLNFLRCYRKKCCAKSVIEVAVQGAKIWNRMSASQKKPYEQMASCAPKTKRGLSCKPKKRRHASCCPKKKRRSSCHRKKRRPSCRRRKPKNTCPRRRKKKSHSCQPSCCP